MKILILAGGFDQIALIQELKKRGHEIILADFLNNPPAKKYVDKHYRISTLDEKAVLELATQQKVSLITTACTDQALLTAAKVSERLNLPCYISAQKALEVTNKFYMKKKFQDNEIPTAQYILLEDENNWFLDASKIERYPVVVKPCDCNSSKGVVKVWNTEELFDAIKGAFELSRSKKVIIEEFIDGDEISIDVWVDNSGVKVLSVSKTCKMNSGNDFTIYRSQYPVINMNVLQTQIYQIVNKIVSAFDLHNCPLLIQAIVKDNLIYVIEFSARMGGGSKYKLIEYMSGINIMEVYVDRILGNIEKLITPCCSTKNLELDYVYAYNGVVNAISGVDELKSRGIIKEYFQYKELGSIITKRNTSSDRVAGFLILADNLKQLQEKRALMLEHLKIKDGDRDIFYKECFLE